MQARLWERPLAPRSKPKGEGNLRDANLCPRTGASVAHNVQRPAPSGMRQPTCISTGRIATKALILRPARAAALPWRRGSARMVRRPSPSSGRLSPYTTPCSTEQACTCPVERVAGFCPKGATRDGNLALMSWPLCADCGSLDDDRRRLDFAKGMAGRERERGAARTLICPGGVLSAGVRASVTSKMSAWNDHADTGEGEICGQRHDRGRLRNDRHDDRGPEAVVGEAE
jgi:hypothetical protein